MLNFMKFPTQQAFFRWQPAAWLRVTGGDALAFLQGQFSNDLKAKDVASRGAIYGLWLNLKGKVVADSFVVPGDGSEAAPCWIGSYFSPAAVIRERLESFIIADDVTVEDLTGEWAAVSLLGDGGAEPAGVRAFRGRRIQEGNTEWVFPAGAGAAVAARLAGWTELGAEAMARQRIAAGIPAVPPDLGPGDLPNEAGLEAEAISYTKGCYLGQEVMARLKSMGQVRRRLVRVAGAGARPAALPAALFLGERQVGEVRSAVEDDTGGFLGLAMVSLVHVGPGAVLALGRDGAPAVQVRDDLTPLTRED
jgi:tRNA-modifying protein YgfZ